MEKRMREKEFLQIALNKIENVFMVNNYRNLVESMSKILQSSCVAGTKKPHISCIKTKGTKDY